MSAEGRLCQVVGLAAKGLAVEKLRHHRRPRRTWPGNGSQVAKLRCKVRVCVMVAIVIGPPTAGPACPPQQRRAAPSSAASPRRPSGRSCLLGCPVTVQRRPCCAARSSDRLLLQGPHLSRVGRWWFSGGPQVGKGQRQARVTDSQCWPRWRKNEVSSKISVEGPRPHS